MSFPESPALAKFITYDESAAALGITIQRCSDDLYLGADGTWVDAEPLAKPIPMERDPAPCQFRIRAVVPSDGWAVGSYIWSAFELNADGSARRIVGIFPHEEVSRQTVSSLFYGYSFSTS